MPQLGETVFEGTVARWLKQPGDAVARQEPLLDITTDKIDTEVPAPAAGTLLKIVAEEGQTVSVGAVIGYIGEEGEEIDETKDDAAKGDAAKGDTARSVDSSHSPVPDTESPAPDSQSPIPDKPTGRAFISPVVGRMAAEHSIDLAQVEGTGLHGRITKKDVQAYLEERKTKGREREVQPTAAETPAAPTFETPPAARNISADETLQPLSAMRRAIAEHMTRSVRTSPHVATVFEADLTAVVRHREAHKAAFAQRGIRLTFTPYFVAAVAAALRENPAVNGRFSDAGLIRNRRIHIGVAVAVAGGLLVPVIRDADERNLQGLARAVNELSAQARAGRLAPDALQGGTFTVTNHGTGGSLLGAPIINQPQAAILGIGKIAKRPVVRSGGHPLLPSADDAIVIRPMCYLSLSFDHRVLDGAGADKFVQAVVDRLENWREDT